jgi:hypothetical protein
MDRLINSSIDRHEVSYQMTLVEPGLQPSIAQSHDVQNAKCVGSVMTSFTKAWGLKTR